MPVRMRYDPEKRISYVTIADPFTMDDLRRVLGDLVSGENHPANVDAIWDGRAVDFGPLDREFTETVVDMRQAFPGRSEARVAFVVPDDLGFGMARMFESLAAGSVRGSRVCRSLAEAEEWLAGSE